MNANFRKAQIIGMSEYALFVIAILLQSIAALCLGAEITIQPPEGHHRDAGIWYDELIFYDGTKEIARQRADNIGNLRPISGRVPDGVAKAYWENGYLNGVIEYQNNFANGRLKTFYPEGKISSEKTYRNGKLHGDIIEYFPDGTLKYKGVYRNGIFQFGRWYNERSILEQEGIRLSDKRKISKTFYNGGTVQGVFYYVFPNEYSLAQAKIYSAEGNLLINATKPASLKDCKLQLSKSLYKVGEPIEFTGSCSCPPPNDCLAPSPRPDFRDKIAIRDPSGKELRMIACPFPTSEYLNMQRWFKDGDIVMRFKWPDFFNQFQFVDAKKLRECKSDAGCKRELCDPYQYHGAKSIFRSKEISMWLKASLGAGYSWLKPSLEAGEYSVWLVDGFDQSIVEFAVE